MSFTPKFFLRPTGLLVAGALWCPRQAGARTHRPARRAWRQWPTAPFASKRGARDFAVSSGFAHYYRGRRNRARLFSKRQRRYRRLSRGVTTVEVYQSDGTPKLISIQVGDATPGTRSPLTPIPQTPNLLPVPTVPAIPTPAASATLPQLPAPPRVGSNSLDEAAARLPLLHHSRSWA